MTKGSPQVTEEFSIHTSSKTLAHAHTCCWMEYSLRSSAGRTGVDLLQRDVLLQEPAEFDLRAVLPTGAIVSQDEVRVAAVEHS